MSKQCVISAHIPKVQRRPRMNTKEAPKGLKREKNDNLKTSKSFINSNTISQVDHDDAIDNNLPFSVDIQVEYMFPRYKTFLQSFNYNNTCSLYENSIFMR
jgi:hypothetical protein